MSLSLQSPVASQSLAFDPHSTETLRRMASRDADAGARAVAKQFETLLMQQMLGAMRQANQGFGEESGGAVDLFRSMQDQQLAQIGALKGGVGLADAIVRQINQQRDPSLLKQARNGVDKTEKVVGAPDKAATAAAKSAVGAAGVASDFIGKVSAAAQDAATALGVTPGLVVAHAALESGWGGKSIKNADGSDSYNLFGIKAGKNWKGKTTDVLTTEFVDGKPQKRVETFRSYDSLSVAFSDYASLIKRRYTDALGQGGDGAGFGRALQAGGYATDPDYASKIARMVESVSARLATRQRNSSQTA